ncbi:hypothetical protein, partial [Brevibacterium samyangense]|uniref:hypothetical protein n=1 Tax=Brevibacterium samyangense TaxID=366888 RepID=UPI0031D424AD
SASAAATSSAQTFSCSAVTSPAASVPSFENVWLRSLGGGVFVALRGGLVAAITQDWLQVGVAV